MKTDLSIDIDTTYHDHIVEMIRDYIIYTVYIEDQWGIIIF